MTQTAPEIFKAYDIRGIVGKSLTEDTVRLIGRALASEAIERSARSGRTQTQSFAVGRDGRLSGPSLSQALSQGLREGGASVTDIGMVATPVTYFAAYHLGTGNCVSVTGSHNPPEYNGLKMVIGGVTLSGDDIQKLRTRIEREQFSSGSGALEKRDILPDYIARIVGDVKLARPMKIAIDCGNGVAGASAGELYRQLGCEVI